MPMYDQYKGAPPAFVYLRIAIQYYVVGRHAALRGQMPVAGNVVHHAVEMLLKRHFVATFTID